MDTSKEYIKMCEQAKEIQNWTAKDRLMDDYIVPKKNIVHFDYKPVTKIIIMRRREIEKGLKPTHFIWLPTQDQLQEMIFKPNGDWQKHPKDLSSLCHNLALFINKNNPPFDKPGYYSMEQLWLAFVMHEKYQKKWNGQEWVKE